MDNSINGSIGYKSYSSGNRMVTKKYTIFGETKLKYQIEEIMKTLKMSNIYPTDEGLDILVIANMVQIADSQINRKKASDDGWSREIKLTIPVLEFKKWKNCTDTLQQMLCFLTGDSWEIIFEEMNREKLFMHLNSIKQPELNENSTHDCISLFSGGVDSLVGAIDSLKSKRNPFFVSHAGESFVSCDQKSVFDLLKKKCKDIERLRFPAIRYGKVFPDISGENSTRGRSFLFFSLGIFVGTGLGLEKFELFVPENGLIALNVPLDPTRFGTLSTRTTHPYYIYLWNELLKKIDIKGTITNLYQYKTKGEMIKECKDQYLLKKLITKSTSCAHPSAGRFKNKADYHHCGYCVPCIIRRSAIKAAWSQAADKTKYMIDKEIYSRPINTALAEGKHLRAFQYAIDRLNENPSLKETLIFTPGPLSQNIEKLKDIAKVYERGMKEVEKFLVDVKTVYKKQ